MKNILYIILLAIVSIPLSVFAEPTFRDYLTGTSKIILILEGVAISAAFLFFVWGLAKFILNSGSESAKDEGKRIMLWGITVLFVISSIAGIINFVRTELEIGMDPYPQFQNIP